MRVLLTTSIFPPDIGGPATHTVTIASALVARGVDVVVLTPSDTASPGGPSYPFQVVRVTRRLARPLRWARTIGEMLRLGRRADVVFVNGLAMEAAIANLVLRKVMVLRVPGDLAWERASGNGWIRDGFEEFQSRRYDLRVELMRRLRSWWTRQADRVIVPSRYCGRWVATWGVPAERITVVPNGISPVGDLPPETVPLGRCAKVAVVGRLIPLKRVDRIIEAVARLDGVGLLVVGEGPERRGLEELAKRLGVEDRVHFAGACSRTKTLALVRAADVLVLNSVCETFSYVLIEAMALGVPVVAAAVGAVPDIVRDGQNGRLVASGDTDELVRVLRSVLASEEERRRLAEAGLDTAREFRTERMVEATDAILRSARA